MLKNILKAIFVLSLVPAGLAAYVFFLYFTSDIDSLKKNNPKKDWVKIERVSYYAKWAIVVSEDWAFYEHQGVDFNQLELVIKESIGKHKLTRGASTISQQVVKNLFFSNERSIIRKFKEMILTYKLEQVLTKDRILELYLNIAELGEDLYGIKAASKFYFNKKPYALSAKEGAFLAMLLPSPKKYSISFRNRELTDYAKSTVDSILVKLRQAKIISEDQRVEMENETFTWEMDNYYFE